MKRVRTKIGRKLIGSLLSCSLLFSMLPGFMTSADGTPTAVQLNFTSNISANTSNSNVSGVNISTNSQATVTKSNTSSQWRFVAGSSSSNATFTFSVPTDPNATYYGYKISKIVIGAATGSSVSVPEGQTGWSSYQSGQDLIWTGTTLQDSVSLSTRRSGSSSYNGRLSFSSVTVYLVNPVTGILIPASLPLSVGDSSSPLTATITPTGATYQSVTWSSSNTAVATVDSNGVVTAVSTGTAIITASAGNGTTATGDDVTSNNCTVTVTNPATGITIDSTLELYAGSSKPITYQVTPAGTTYDSITWSVTSGSGVDVSNTGVVSASATATGTATIRADLIVDGSSVAYDTCEVTINTPATGIAIDNALTLYAGGSGTINYTIDPPGADYDSIAWSVTSGSGVTVSNTGVVTATTAGTATVQADLIVGGSSVASDTCEITVNTPAAGIDLPASTSVFVGSSATLSYTLSPEGATFDSITWSVTDPLGAPISINSTTGLITAGSSTGTATVRAAITVGDAIYFDECTVTVCEIPVSAVTIDPSSATVAVGGSAALTAVVDPTTATASDWVWKVDDDTIAEISWDAGTCTVTGLAEGTAEVTVTIGGKSDTCTITVISGEEPSITVSPSSLTLTVDGESGELSYTIVDCGHDITFLGFASSDTAVATVSEDGIVTPVGEGTATITATMMDNTLEQTYSAICDVTVSSEPGPGPEPGPEPGPDPEPEEPVLTYEEIVRIVVSNFVDRLYLVALNRPYDSAGREDWINQLMNGGSASGVARGFLTSAEFIGRDLSNEQFVTVLYKVYFDREPDATGFTNWVNALNNGTSRVQVMAEFAKSEEWAAFCARYYVVV